MSPISRRAFTDEQKADFSERSSVAVRIVPHTPTAERSSTRKTIGQIDQNINLTACALRNWLKQFFSRSTNPSSFTKRGADTATYRFAYL